MNKEQKTHDFSKDKNDNLKKINKNVNNDLTNEGQNKNNINVFENTNSDKKEVFFDIPVNISVELGRSRLKIKDLLKLSKGSTLLLNRTKEDPLKIFANNQLIALGEIVFSDNKYGIRIINIKNSLNNASI